MTYFAERQREKLYSYQEEDLRPYFSLPRVLDGLFALVTRLFDVEIVAADGKAPVWNKDVRFFQINRNGKPAAYFYLDPYSVCIQAILRSLCVVCPCAIAAARRAT